MADLMLRRGTIFRAEHDESFSFWASAEPRWKLCIVFNVTPPADADDVHYFLTTSKVDKFRENPSVLSDTLIFPPGTYAFFPVETLVDFRSLCIAPFDKLIHKGLKVLGELRPDDLARCERAAGAARILENRAKRLIGLRS